MNLTRTRVARALTVGAALGTTMGVAIFGPTGMASADSVPPVPLPAADAAAIVEGNVARCSDGTYSDNTDFDARHAAPTTASTYRLAPFGSCSDGAVIALSETARCDDHDGFGALLPSDFVPQPGPADVALARTGPTRTTRTSTPPAVPEAASTFGSPHRGSAATERLSR